MWIIRFYVQENIRIFNKISRHILLALYIATATSHKSSYTLFVPYISCVPSERIGVFAILLCRGNTDLSENVCRYMCVRRNQRNAFFQIHIYYLNICRLENIYIKSTAVKNDWEIEKNYDFLFFSISIYRKTNIQKTYTGCISVLVYVCQPIPTTSVQIWESYTAMDMVHNVLKRLFTRFNRSNKFRVGLTGQHVTLFFNNRLGSARQ